MLAIIQTGGKQYLVSPGQKIKIEKLDKPASAKATAGEKEGWEVVFKRVLLLEKNKKLEIGNPFVSGAEVTGKVLKQGKGKKLIAFKYKAKKRYKVKKGHRQPFIEVEIKEIVMPKS